MVNTFQPLEDSHVQLLTCWCQNVCQTLLLIVGRKPIAVVKMRRCEVRRKMNCLKVESYLFERINDSIEGIKCIN